MEPERISFPALYPIKVVAHATPDLRARVDAAFLQHCGAAAAGNVTERPSANSNFVSLTYSLIVQNEAQLRTLHEDLMQVDGVVMVL